MDGRRHTSSTLHLQMGQEVMYLLLVTSLLANFILAALALRHAKNSDETLSPPQLPPIGITKPAATPVTKPPPPPVASPQPPTAPTEAKLPPQPPIIPLREDEGFRFPAGSSEVSLEFEMKLRAQTVPDIIKLSELYDAQIVEVIGHTDGTSIRDSSRLKANLDDTLGPFTLGTSAILPFPYDNVGLGMARAATVAKALRQAGLPATLDIHPLSAGYLLAPNDRFDPARLKKDDSARRRIDIRIRRINSN